MSRTMHIGSWYDTGVPLEGRGDGSTGYGTCARGWITMGPVAPGILMGRPSLGDVSQSVDLGQNNNPNTTPTKDYENVQVVVYLRGVQRGCAEEGERGSTPTG